MSWAVVRVVRVVEAVEAVAVSEQVGSCGEVRLQGQGPGGRGEWARRPGGGECRYGLGLAAGAGRGLSRARAFMSAAR